MSNCRINIFEPGSVLNNKWIWTGVAVAIIAVFGMTVWHLVGETGYSSKAPKNLSVTNKEVNKNHRSDIGSLEITLSDTPKQTILAEDGASMHFIPAGMAILPENSTKQSERSIKVNPFYMDETLVTNHQYVEFLNHNFSEVRLERGAVIAEDEIWLFLGQVKEDYEPIVFRKGEFKVSKKAYAFLPALRVTAYGASAYARSYNRRLPTYTEWLRALGSGELPLDKTSSDDDESREEANNRLMHGQMHSRTKMDVSEPESPDLKLSPVLNDQPNKYGIRGMNKNVKEWGLMVSEATSRDNIREAEYVVLPTTILRYPWEGFGEVGFRCVREVKIIEK